MQADSTDGGLATWVGGGGKGVEGCRAGGGYSKLILSFHIIFISHWD